MITIVKATRSAMKQCRQLEDSKGGGDDGSLEAMTIGRCETRRERQTVEAGIITCFIGDPALYGGHVSYLPRSWLIVIYLYTSTVRLLL